MCKVYGYLRVSTDKQKTDRQRENILGAYPDAHMVEDKYTGTKVAGRVQFEKLIKNVKAGDTIVFDEVSRMSRNAAEGIALYKQMMEKGVELVFIKEPHINTQTYKQQLKGLEGRKTESSGDADADKLINGIMGAVNEYMIRLAEKQIELAFNTAEAEAAYIRQRVKEGKREQKRRNEMIEAGMLEGKITQWGGSAHRTPKKKAAALEGIKKYSSAFNGANTDEDTMKLVKLSRNTYYKYKKELLEQEYGSKGE